MCYLDPLLKFKILGKEWERERIFLAIYMHAASSLLFYMLKEAYFLETVGLE